ncbi:hypothetical protein PIB30_033177 [Stylosanthes scabra]|uniref:Uncharacterized protein n=1 Tax=Stylosanthes scabra TaxID=79078 RepID=A0ABU6ZB49_9FABA|nr:hypothetical protein [Stylosanthes scabra]
MEARIIWRRCDFEEVLGHRETVVDSFTVIMAAFAASHEQIKCAIEREEEVIIPFGDEDIQEGVEKCLKSLVGKIMADRKFSSGTLEAALYSVYTQFLFSMRDKEDRILKVQVSLDLTNP